VSIDGGESKIGYVERWPAPTLSTKTRERYKHNISPPNHANIKAHCSSPASPVPMQKHGLRAVLRARALRRQRWRHFYSRPLMLTEVSI